MNDVKFFLCGDVMTGRGIDQVLPYPSDPHIQEPYIRDARRYVSLAENFSGPIPKPLSFSEIWGDALAELKFQSPDVSLINLETAVTESSDLWQGKGINYRMSTRNAPVLPAAGINIASLANNHVLDWGYGGLEETIRTLSDFKISLCGAGRNLAEASAPAIVQAGIASRVVVFSYALESSGVPPAWAAGENMPGVNLLQNLSDATVSKIAEQVRRVKRAGDIVIASIHWGGNWGYQITAEEERFAHAVIEKAAVDLVHGHSSHHVKRIEVHRGKLILYGCGDLLNDYEGIPGHEYYEPDLGLLFFPIIEPAAGRLVSLVMTPTRVRGFRILSASRSASQRLARILNREGNEVGTGVVLDEEERLHLTWDNRA